MKKSIYVVTDDVHTVHGGLHPLTAKSADKYLSLGEQLKPYEFAQVICGTADRHASMAELMQLSVTEYHPLVGSAEYLTVSGDDQFEVRLPHGKLIPYQ